MKNIRLSTVLMIMLSAVVKINSQTMNNPILKNSDDGFLFAADPAAEVFNGKVYVYCSRDQPDATNYSGMQDYMVLESSDMENWINHGVVLKPRIDAGFEWADGQMNAPDVAYKDGWYYFYFPFDKTYIGVAKSQDPVGLPTSQDSWMPAVSEEITAIFDPTVFVDDDGQAYIYGNDLKVRFDGSTYIYGAKLKDNMVELDGPWVRLTQETVSEAVHVFKRNGIYYFHARVGGVTEYWTADSPLPEYATHQGLLASNSPDSPNHASVIEFEDQWYFFYHRGDVNDGSFFKRSACVDPMYFNADGTIQEISYSLREEVRKPENAIEAESLNSETGGVVNEGSYIGYIKDDYTVTYNNVDLSSGNYDIDIRYSSQNSDVTVNFETPTGTVLGSVNLSATNSWTSWYTSSENLDFAVGTTDLVLRFLNSNTGANLCNIDWFALTNTDSVISSPDGAIEAEDYDSKSNSIVNQGSHIGYITNGSIVSYNDLNLIATDYEVTLNYSSKNSASIVSFETSEGGVLGTIDLPVTGEWDQWREISATINFPVSTSDLVVRFLHPDGNSGLFLCNLDWFKLQANGGILIEAEGFDAQQGGIVDETTHMGFVKGGSSVQYNDTNISANNYAVTIRYSAKQNSSIVNFKTANNQILGTITLPSTGNWNTWNEITEVLNFSIPQEDLIVEFLHPSGNTTQYLCNIDWFEFVPSTTSAKSIFDSNAVIYPSLASSIVTVEGASGSTISIYDMNGRLLLTTYIYDDIEQFDLSNLKTGVYYAKISGINNNSTIKIVKP